jgi:hypothetical protein
MKKILYLSLILFSFSSCIEIIDDLSLNSDGSGTFKYVVNLSSSKIKVNSVLALDSLDGKKVPSLSEIKEIIKEYQEKIEAKEGISNVKVDTDFTNFILKFQCDFANVSVLQKAIREIVIEKDKQQEFKEINHIWLSWDGAKLSRSVPTLTTQTTQKLKQEDINKLKEGSYISITRFDKTIEKSENPLAKISPSKLACMIKTNPYTLVNNLNLIENTIMVSTNKK